MRTPTQPTRRKRPKTAHNYRRGADFERRVLAYLCGDTKKKLKGVLHSLIGRKKILVYGQRSAGSRGDLDLIVILTKNTTAGRRCQVALGIQCKISRPSLPLVQNHVVQLTRSTGVHTLYAWRSGKKIVFYPDLAVSVRQLIEEYLP